MSAFPHITVLNFMPCCSLYRVKGAHSLTRFLLCSYVCLSPRSPSHPEHRFLAKKGGLSLAPAHVEGGIWDVAAYKRTPLSSAGASMAQAV